MIETLKIRLRGCLAAAFCSLAAFATQIAGAQTPTVSGVAFDGNPATGDTYELAEVIDVQVTFDRDVDVTGRPQLALSIGSTTRQAGYYSRSGRTIYYFRYIVQSSDNDSDGISIGANALTLNGGTIKIGGGTTNAVLSLGTHAIANSANHKVDGSRMTAPTVDLVDIHDRTSGDTFELTENIDVSVVFDRTVDVTGTPQLALTIGSTTRQADYAGSSTGRQLDFSYAVQSSDSDSDGISIGANALTLNGGTIRIRGGTTNAALSLGTHAIANSANHKVDGSQETAPTVSAVSIFSRLVLVGGTFELADEILLRVGFDRPVNVTGTPQLALTIGSVTRQANYYATTDGSRSIWFIYAVQSTDTDSDGISIGANALTLNGGTIRIRGGTTNATLGLGTHAITNSANHKVDGSQQTAPTVSDVTISSPLNGDTFDLAESITVRVTFNRTVAAMGRLQLELTIGSTTRQASQNYFVTFRSRQLVFSYSVQPSDRDADGISISANALTLDGGTLRHVGGTTNAALSLGSHAIINSAGHRVDGSRETAPAVTRVVIWPDPANGSAYELGELLTVSVYFDRRVDATGQQELALTIGSARRQARGYFVTSNSSVLSFTYVVQSSDRDSDGISIGASALTLNGGTIKTHQGNANASLNLGSHAILNSTNHKVDGSVETTPAVNGFTLRRPARGGDTFEFGEAIYTHVAFDRVVDVGGEPQLALTIGSTTRQASFYRQFIDRTLEFQYVVQSTDADADGISVGASALTLNGGTIRTRGGTANASLNLGSRAISNSANHKVDGSRETAPRVIYVWIVSRPEGGDYSTGAEIVVRVYFDRAVEATGVPQLALTIGGATRQASYVEHLGPGAVARYAQNLYFRYVVQSSDHDPDGISIGANALSLNGGTITTQGSATNAALDIGVWAISDSWVHKVNVGGTTRAPTQVRAEATATGLLVTWAAATGAASYRVQWRLAGQAWSSSRQAETTATRLQIDGLAPGSYEVRVVAVVDGREGEASSTTEGEVAAQGNTAPRPTEELPELVLDVGETKTVELASAFKDPNNDPLRFTASADSNAVSVQVVQGAARIRGVRPGEATVGVTATDPDGLSASATFKVAVGALLSLSGDAVAPEGGTVALTLALSRALAEPLDVSWRVVADGDAATPDANAGDYEGPRRTKEEEYERTTIAAGQTSASIEIAILDDDVVEPAREHFIVALDEPQDSNVGLSRNAQVAAAIQEGVCDRTAAVRDELAQNWQGCHWPRPLDLSQVSTLTLDSRGIDALRSDDLLGLDGLESLDLRGNNLSMLPANLLAKTPRLRHLDLSANALETLPESLFAGLGRLRQVSLEGNPGAPFGLAVELVRTDANPWAPGPATVSTRIATGAPFAMAAPLTVSPAPVAGHAPPATVEIDGGATAGTAFAAASVANAPLTLRAEATPTPAAQCGGAPCFRGFETTPGSALILFHRPPRALAAPTPEPLAGGDALRVRLDSLVAAGDAPDGMRWEASSSDESVATVRIVGADLLVEPEPAGEGTAEITLVAADAFGFAATMRFEVQVEFHWPRTRGWRSIFGNTPPDTAAEAP